MQSYWTKPLPVIRAPMNNDAPPEVFYCAIIIKDNRQRKIYKVIGQSPANS